MPQGKKQEVKGRYLKDSFSEKIKEAGQKISREFKARKIWPQNLF